MSLGLWRTFERVVQARGDGSALLHGDRSMTFASLRQEALVFASRLVSLGLEPGDRCLICSSNSMSLAAAILGVWRAGGIVALVNDEAPVSHLEHAVSVVAPRVIIASTQWAHDAATIHAGPILVLGEPFSPIDVPIPSFSVHDHEPASIFFTSGSTGRPKGVTQTHLNLSAGCQMVAAYLGLRVEDRILCPIPWAFDYGYGQFLSMVLLGVTMVLPAAKHPAAICEAIELHRPTVFAGLPAIFALLRSMSPLRQTDLTSLRLITNTGGRIPAAVFADMLDIFSHCQISLNYGMTETYRSAGLPFNLAQHRPESVGYAYPGVSLAVVNEFGKEAEPGELGEIIHRGPGTFAGYWANPEATAKVLRPDPLWRHRALPPPLVVFTGDLGRKDQEGMLTIEGRRDRLIKSMGVRVSPDEVEMILTESRLAREAIVFGISHDLLGEMVVAAVILTDEHPQALTALKSLARERLSQPMQPREYFVFDTFPLTPNGKTDISRLKEQILQRRRGKAEKSMA